MDYDFGVGYSLNYRSEMSFFLFLFLMILYIVFFRKKIDLYRALIIGAFLVYMFSLVGETLSPIPINEASLKYMQVKYQGYELMNLIPFFGLKHKTYFYQFVLNIIMFIPFGILFPACTKKIRVFENIMAIFFLTLFIEITQLFMSLFFGVSAWHFDINDIIANFVGGVFGFVIIIIINKYIFKDYLNEIEVNYYEK